jgi:hypothetical protein
MNNLQILIHVLKRDIVEYTKQTYTGFEVRDSHTLIILN